MLLACDVGNTNIHLGLWDGNSWALNWRARTVHDKMPDEYAVLVRNFLNSADVGYKAIHGVVIGSVVPALTRTFIELVQRYLNLEPVIVNATTASIPVMIDQPEQAGADRIANAAAVVALHGGGPAIVVDFGTATNFDVVSVENAYIGGAIAPGIGVAHDALVSRAARLHKIDLMPPPDAIGANTIHAMQSGIFWGYVALIEGLTQRIRTSLEKRGTNGKSIRVIATGGLAVLVNEHTDVFDLIAPELTLDGLRVIYEHARQPQNGRMR
ncbi:MAG: type III pantothenate kinase [bacterium]|nr:type III pantothenate kinase [bacterium]